MLLKGGGRREKGGGIFSNWPLLGLSHFEHNPSRQSQVETIFNNSILGRRSSRALTDFPERRRKIEVLLYVQFTFVQLTNIQHSQP
jgi:hypothetical protein